MAHGSRAAGNAGAEVPTPFFLVFFQITADDRDPTCGPLCRNPSVGGIHPFDRSGFGTLVVAVHSDLYCLRAGKRLDAKHITVGAGSGLTRRDVPGP